jgi:hypothetical protein
MPDSIQLSGRYADLLMELHADMRVQQEWRKERAAEMVQLQALFRKMCDDITSLCARMSVVEAAIAHEKTGLLAWKVTVDLEIAKIHERCASIEEEVDGRASSVDVERLMEYRTRSSERAKAMTETNPLKVAKIGATAVVIAACIGAGWAMPTSCSGRAIPAAVAK